jgi:hypothetical protein
MPIKPSPKNTQLDDLATTCKGIGGVGARHDQILSHGRPSLAKSEPTVQKCSLLFSLLVNPVGNSL